MILLSISPFIFNSVAEAASISMDAASILERRTAVPRCALFVLSEISAARRIRRLLPFRSICRRAATGPQSYFWLRESPPSAEKYSKRS